MYVIGADEQQFEQIQKKLNHSGIKVIKQNNLTSEFDQLTLVSAISYPIETVESAIDQVVYTRLAHGMNQFYTNSAGLYFPTYQPKMVDMFTNSCNGHSITFITYEDNFFKLTVEYFSETDQGYEYITISEYQGTFTVDEISMKANSKNGSFFTANKYFEKPIQADGLHIFDTDIPQMNEPCTIIKRKNHS